MVSLRHLRDSATGHLVRVNIDRIRSTWFFCRPHMVCPLSMVHYSHSVSLFRSRAVLRVLFELCRLHDCLKHVYISKNNSCVYRVRSKQNNQEEDNRDGIRRNKRVRTHLGFFIMDVNLSGSMITWVFLLQ
jgi:hypothetical protein